MAIIIDDKARAAIERRRARGREATLFLRIERIRARGAPFGGFSDIVAGWNPQNPPDPVLTVTIVGDVEIRMEARIARYSYWHDVPVSAWRVGPIDLLVVHPAVLLDMQAWERKHPLDEQRTIA